ncbi:hypothetical protein AB0I94_34395 [Streptomyces sp. NPDC050147]|uniref:hypothetical protein n=1 Tax=Streptomyces sp. NPDC050147 TaxID=3155513 RepID=UPI00343EBF04
MEDATPDHVMAGHTPWLGRTKVLVAIIWRPAPGRAWAHHVTTAHWHSVLPGTDVIDVDTDVEPFNRAACRNAGVRLAEQNDADVVILSDADILVEPAPVRAAITQAATSGQVHLPYTELRSLQTTGSSEYSAGVPLPACHAVTVDQAAGGVYVTAAATWWSLGGQDTRFRGWGFEDASFDLAHRTLMGTPPKRHNGRAYTLHHPEAVKEGAQYEANLALCKRYHRASGDRAAMQALISESRGQGQP